MLYGRKRGEAIAGSPERTVYGPAFCLSLDQENASLLISLIWRQEGNDTENLYEILWHASYLQYQCSER